jgi:hypothetical protein
MSATTEVAAPAAPAAPATTPAAATTAPAAPAAPAPEAPAPAAEKAGTVLGGESEADAAGEPGTDQADPTSVPDKYDIKAPDGVELDPAAIQAFSEVAKAVGLSNEQAQKLVDFQAKRDQEIVQASDRDAAAALSRMTAEDHDALKKDPELGGANYELTKQQAMKGFLKFADAEDIKFINESKLGDQVPLIKIFRKVFLAFREDTAGVGTGNASRAIKTEEDFQRAMYPSMFKDKED